MTFSPDGRTAIAGSPHNRMSIVDLQPGKTIATRDEYFNWSPSTSFSRNGQTFAVTTGSQQVQIWRMGQ